MKLCPEENAESAAPMSQVRIKILRLENGIVRDAIDHLRDDGMTNMANAVELMLLKYERLEIRNEQEILSHSAGEPVHEMREGSPTP